MMEFPITLEVLFFTNMNSRGDCSLQDFAIGGTFYN